MDEGLIRAALERAWQGRAARFEAAPSAMHSAWRLFNGFVEGGFDLSAELYAETLVLINHADPPEALRPALRAAQAFYLERLPWLRCVVVKERHAPRHPPGDALRRGCITYGDTPADRVSENGVWYALDLRLHQDTSFYLDTRHLREWARQNLAGQRVLNTFAYTGSLGVAALAGGAAQVIQLDRDRQFLALARRSYELNGLPFRAADFYAGDFFSGVSQLKRASAGSPAARFDCVFLDPPFFSVTARGRVDLLNESARLINKVRPLLRDGGWLAAINNALFLSGAEYLKTLERLCADGYLSLEALIPVPQDCFGYAQARPLPADPAPFNHATKIALLRVKRKA